MRHLPPQLKTFLDQKLLGLLLPDDPAALLVQVARCCVGVTEQGGDNHGPLVEAFQSAVGSPMGQSWCMDFVQACIAYVEARLGVQSPVAPGEHCLTVWERSKAICGVSSPIPGDVIVWEHGDTQNGHTGIIVSFDSLRYLTIEGNTSDAAEINREGDGVYQKFRAKGGSKTFKEVGFLRVFGTQI